MLAHFCTNKHKFPDGHENILRKPHEIGERDTFMQKGHNRKTQRCKVITFRQKNIVLLEFFSFPRADFGVFFHIF